MNPRIQVAPALRGRVSISDVRRLERAVRRVARGLGLRAAAVSVRIMDEPEMVELKSTHLQEQAVTDVLSFPAPDEGGGDVALCWPVAQKQAAVAGCSPVDEAVRLVIHGLAHLVGHDHGSRHEARRMLRVERRALRRLGVPDVARPYDERGGVS